MSKASTSSTKTTAQVLAGVGLYLAMGLSLGWYYTFTYYGRAGWPMPQVEPCGALLLYYFSVLNVDTEYQAVHWMLVFPLAGVLWAIVICRVARRMSIEGPGVATAFAAFSLAAIPLALPALWMTWVGGAVDGEFTFLRMMAVALRRGHVTPWAGLSPGYFALGVVGIAIHGFIYRRLFAVRGLRGLVHWGISGGVYVLVCVVMAAMAAIPVRILVE